MARIREDKKTRKSAKELEAEKREEGLATSLDQSNKGFAMLQKMGFKPGQQTVFAFFWVPPVSRSPFLLFLIFL